MSPADAADMLHQFMFLYLFCTLVFMVLYVMKHDSAWGEKYMAKLREFGPALTILAYIIFLTFFPHKENPFTQKDGLLYAYKMERTAIYIAWIFMTFISLQLLFFYVPSRRNILKNCLLMGFLVIFCRRFFTLLLYLDKNFSLANSSYFGHIMRDLTVVLPLTLFLVVFVWVFHKLLRTRFTAL